MDLERESRALYEASRSASPEQRGAALESLGQHLYRALWPRVKGDPRLEHLAADCAQDALVTIWQQILGGRGPDLPERFLSWSARIAMNKLLDELRKLEPSPRVQRSKRVALSRQLSLDATDAPDGRPLADRLRDDGEPGAEERLAYAEMHALLSEIHGIRDVSEQSRTVLMKGYLEGWDDHELAEHLDTSQRNVHVIRCRDLAKLRRNSDFMARLRVYYQ